MFNEAEFVEQVVQFQRRLYVYIFQLVPNATDASDILQEANLVLWQKREEFCQGTEFGSWALRIAHFKVLSYLKQRQRSKLRLDENLVEQLADEAATEVGAIETEQQALGACIEALSLRDRDLLQQRYVDNRKPKGIAEETGRSPGAISRALFRVRASLLACMQKKLIAGGEG